MSGFPNRLSAFLFLVSCPDHLDFFEEMLVVLSHRELQARFESDESIMLDDPLEMVDQRLDLSEREVYLWESRFQEHLDVPHANDEVVIELWNCPLRAVVQQVRLVSQRAEGNCLLRIPLLSLVRREINVIVGQEREDDVRMPHLAFGAAFKEGNLMLRAFRIEIHSSVNVVQAVYDEVEFFPKLEV